MKEPQPHETYASQREVPYIHELFMESVLHTQGPTLYMLTIHGLHGEGSWGNLYMQRKHGIHGEGSWGSLYMRRKHGLHGDGSWGNVCGFLWMSFDVGLLFCIHV